MGSANKRTPDQFKLLSVFGLVALVMLLDSSVGSAAKKKAPKEEKIAQATPQEGESPKLPEEEELGAPKEPTLPPSGAADIPQEIMPENVDRSVEGAPNQEAPATQAEAPNERDSGKKLPPTAAPTKKSRSQRLVKPVKKNRPVRESAKKDEPKASTVAVDQQAQPAAANEQEEQAAAAAAAAAQNAEADVQVSASKEPTPGNGADANSQGTPPPAETATTPPATAQNDAANGAPPEMGSPPAEAPAKTTPPKPARTAEKPSEDKVGADLVPEGQELVNIDFPEPTDIKDIIRAVSLWTGKNVILGRDVSGKVQMISPRKVTKIEAYQAFLSALNLLGLTTVETGKVIKIVPVRSAMKSNLKTFLGASWTPMTDELITQIVPLKYIDAKEVQTTLSRIVSSNSMIAYEPTNTLIISDSGYKVRRILDIIDLLDVQTQQPKLEVVPIRYGDAKSIQAMVQNIFQAQASGKGVKKTSFLTYKIMTDERTNSVVIFGPPRTIADVKALVRKFDVRTDDSGRQSQIHVRPLDYADSQKLASTLASLATGGKKAGAGGLRRPPMSPPDPKAPNPSLGGGEAPVVASLDDDVKITSDEASNSLLITGSRAAYDAINSIVRKLDIRRSQVFVEAEILDIVIKNGFRFQTSIFGGYGRKDGQGTKYATTWEASGMAPLIQAQASKTVTETSAAKAGEAFREDLTVGILAGNKVNIPGFGEISPGALIKMIKQDGFTKVLSSPHILTSNNEAAKISVGNKLFFKGGGEVSSSGTVVEKVQSEDVDLTLELKPNISHSNYVTMKIDLDASTGNIDSDSRLPTVLKRKTSQNVTVKNGQTVVISGLVKTSEIEVYRKIPLLGDIPILGWLFRNTDIQKEKSNLMIFLTPYIIHGANDLAAIYQKKVQERDEIFSKIYGSSFKEDDFYNLLPSEQDGLYRADAFDLIDERNRKDRKEGMMRDMGYSKDEIKKIKANESGSVPEPKAEESTQPAGSLELQNGGLYDRGGGESTSEGDAPSSPIDAEPNQSLNDGGDSLPPPPEPNGGGANDSDSGGDFDDAPPMDGDFQTKVTTPGTKAKG